MAPKKSQSKPRGGAFGSTKFDSRIASIKSGDYHHKVVTGIKVAPFLNSSLFAMGEHSIGPFFVATSGKPQQVPTHQVYDMLYEMNSVGGGPRFGQFKNFMGNLGRKVENRAKSTSLATATDSKLYSKKGFVPGLNEDGFEIVTLPDGTDMYFEYSRVMDHRKGMPEFVPEVVYVKKAMTEYRYTDSDCKLVLECLKNEEVKRQILAIVNSQAVSRPSSPALSEHELAPHEMAGIESGICQSSSKHPRHGV